MARVAFCQDVMVEYMGFMSISAVLKKAGHTVELFFDEQTNEERFIEQLARFQPDIIGFSILSPSAPWAVRVGEMAKAATGAITICGNVHAITAPQIIEHPGMDIVCIGEGEMCMLELCSAVDHGEDFSRIEGLWVKTEDGSVVRNCARRELVDMDALPFVDRGLYNKYAFFRNSAYLRVMTGRGCPFRCSFCTNPILADHYGGAKTYIRKQTPERAIREIESLVANHPHKVSFLFFIDEVFWVKNEWLREFLALYRDRIRIPFDANFRFGAILENDVKLLADAGAAILNVAVESGDEKQRKGIMNKPVSDEHIFQVTTWMRKYGIKFGSSCFFGLPGDTFQDHVERLGFYRKLNPTYLWTTFFQPYPGLALTQNEDIKKYTPESKAFEVTLHHDMYLDLPDRDRLVNLKKVYFLCTKFPALAPLLLWLTKFNIPFLFDVLFMAHFSYYIFRFERVSLFQWLVHVKVFALNPLLRRKQPLQNIGRPFGIPWRKKALKDQARNEAQTKVV
ncbi:MAG: B12-binding domain-containing radical SAM protein [Candidatus Hydrogenedentes bacterium]|nr:B12-binding domain-containing radical SAM protein [Candidatus Hydrogenedentota bacterium]